ncbi:MAG: phosphatase PAP2 family protein [Spirochaetota bacterium]
MGEYLVLVTGYLGWFYAMLSVYVRRRWFYCIAGFMIIGVALSRVYLGVYFPADILGGWLLGGVVLCAWWLWKRFYRPSPHRDRVVLLTAVCLVLVAALLLATNYWRTYPLGLLAGALLGYVQNQDKPESVPLAKNGWWKPVLRMLTGFPILLLLAQGTRNLASKAGYGKMELLIIFAGLTVCGLWISVGAFYLFGMLMINDK